MVSHRDPWLRHGALIMIWNKEASLVFVCAAMYGEDYCGLETQQEQDDDWYTWCAGQEL